MKKTKGFMTSLLICCCALGVAQPNKAKRITFEKQNQLSKLEIDGYTNKFIKIVEDTTDLKSKRSYTIYEKKEKLSNGFAVELTTSYGICRKKGNYNGNLIAFKKNGESGIIRGPKENIQPNTKDSSWVVTINGNKILLNYYYCFFAGETGEVKAKCAVIAHYDNGISFVNVKIRQPKSLAGESGATKLKTEEEFRSKLPKVGELEQEACKAITIYLNNL